MTYSARYLSSRAKFHGDETRRRTAEFCTLDNATLAMYQAGGDNWNHGNQEVRDALVANQSHGRLPSWRWDSKGTH